MKIKTAKLTGTALNWAVAKCDNRKVRFGIGGSVEVRGQTEGGNELPDHLDLWMLWNPSTNWEQGGSIIDRVKGLTQHTWLEANRLESQCECRIHNYEGDWVQFGATPLIAAMRCFVASKLGGEVELPEEKT
jgi:hypothetical protein